MTTEVEQLLIDKGVQYFSKGKDLLVKCFNPEHEDENPSLRISREDGAFHCFGCGYKGNIFPRFNRHRNMFSSKVREVQQLIADLRKVSWAGIPLPEDAVEYSLPFRGIPKDILTKFGAFTTSKLNMEGRLVFPITDHMGIVQGLQGRYLHSALTPKYLAYPAEVSLPWFPAPDKIRMINNSIVLTEGLLDALYLHGKGITNAVTIFGTKSVTFDSVTELLNPFILAGCEKVYLLMDGDAAGRSAGELISKLIAHRTELLVEVLPIDDDIDPATMEESDINRLKNYLQNN